MRDIEGLPEGVQIVRIGKPCSTDFYWRSGDIYAATDGAGWTGAELIIKPADGYQFVFDARSDRYRVTQSFRMPWNIVVTYAIHNQLELEAVKGWIKRQTQAGVVKKVDWGGNE